MVSHWPQQIYKSFIGRIIITNNQQLLPFFPRKDTNKASPIDVLRTDQGMMPLKFTQKTKEFMRLSYRARSTGLQTRECALKQSHSAFIPLFCDKEP